MAGARKIPARRQPGAIPEKPMNLSHQDDVYVRNGVLAGILAFAMWGAFPIYFQIADGVGAVEMLLHRIFWSVPFGLLIILARSQWPEVRRIVRDRRCLLYLLLSSVFITINWLVYTWAVQNEQIYQASLGYYINPLTFLLVGFVFLGERLRRMQSVAVLLATAGVLVLTFAGGQFPLISITLAISFTIYGVVRKQVVVGAMPGLFVETVILFPFSVLGLFVLLRSGVAAFTPDDPGLAALLILAGPLTVLPLLFFAISARRLRLGTIGFLQFIGPTGQFLVGYYYGEPLTIPHIICFTLIWTAVAVFVLDVWLHGRKAPVAIPVGTE